MTRGPRVPRCQKCGATLTTPPAELADGLPGVKYQTCNACGYVRAVTRRPPVDRKWLEGDK